MNATACRSKQRRSASRRVAAALAPSSPNGLVEHAEALAVIHARSAPREATRSLGQVFTPPAIARFLASLLPTPGASLRLLDPGAGTGILAAAVCERVLGLRRRRRVHIEAFELDSGLRPSLRSTLDRCMSALSAAGHAPTYAIQEGDFVLKAGQESVEQGLFVGTSAPALVRFDAVVMNPPYSKISSESEHAAVARQLFGSHPNTYSLFMALGLASLRPGGTLVSITPRSFCNGPYFRSFREFLLSSLSIGRLHAFRSRSATFRAADVLQESIVLSGTRQPNQEKRVVVSVSEGAEVTSCTTTTLPVDRVIARMGSDSIIRIAETAEDSLVLNLVKRWPHRLEDLGLRVSTGPVVHFRCLELLTDLDGPRTTPLLWPHNVSPYCTQWPIEKRGKAKRIELSERSRRLLVDPVNMVLIRRFSAKEERRRLTAAALLPRELGWQQSIGIENHLNYLVHSSRELTADEAFGIAAILNSVLMDTFFRALSGSTQVNATELRALPMPDLVEVARIGRAVRRGLAEGGDQSVDVRTLRAIGLREPIIATLLENAA